MSKFDVIVIGAGPGGYVAAIRAAQEGLNVALVEKADIGGTCLNRGCIPTKSLVHSAALYREMKHSAMFGIHAEGISYNWGEIHARKAEVVQQMRDGVGFLLNANRVNVIKGTAKITAPGEIEVTTDEGTQTLNATSIIIASGAVPAMPPIPGLDLPGVITSDELLTSTSADYKRLTIVGGGVIGVEFAEVYSGLGCEVTIIEAESRILPMMDKDISQNLSMIMKKRGVTIHTGAMLEKVEQSGNALSCTFDKKGKTENVESDAVIVAIGRRPMLAGLLAEGLNIEVKRGIVVDNNFQTTVPGIYAIGDVVDGTIQLAHNASAQAMNVIAYITGNQPPVDLSAVPSCIYTEPEIAAVGITAEQAKEQGVAVKIGKFNMAGNGKSVIDAQERGFVKLIFAEDGGQILGAQLMCGRATDLISELSAAIVNKQTDKDIAHVMRPHPTFSESISEAAEDAEGRAIHIAPKRK